MKIFAVLGIGIIVACLLARRIVYHGWGKNY